MWILSVLLFLPFSNIVMGEDLENCVAEITKYDFKNLIGADLESICPLVTNLLNCVDNVVKYKTGHTMEDLQYILRGTEIGNGARVFVNTKDVVRDLCTEGSDLHKRSKESAACFKNVSRSDQTLLLQLIYVRGCMKKAVEAYEAYTAVEEERGVYGHSDKECMVEAYKSACYAEYIYKKCGQSSFELHQEVVKRIGLFRILLCSPEALENLKTKFLESLDMEENKRAIYRAGFDLRKRRK